MRLAHVLLSLPLLTLLAGVPAAEAGPKSTKGAAAKEETLPKIEATGIAEFDDVFMKAKAIHDTLDAEDANLKEARKQVALALGVAEDAPLKTALEDLKTKANGKLKVAFKGTMPRLEASEAVPENVQAALDAVNKLIDAGGHTVASATELVPQAAALVAACADFPSQLSSMNLEPMKLIEATKKVTGNVKTTGATPDRIDRLVKTSEGVFLDVKGTFAE